MQRERVIALAPVVAHTLVTIDDQGVDRQLPQACGNRQTRLTGSDHDDGRIALEIGRILQPSIEPVGLPEIARIVRAPGPRAPKLLFMTTNRIERGHQRPGTPWRAGPSFIGPQPEDALAGTH